MFRVGTWPYSQVLLPAPVSCHYRYNTFSSPEGARVVAIKNSEVRGSITQKKVLENLPSVFLPRTMFLWNDLSGEGLGVDFLQ